MEVGSHCQVETCNALDFLPFVCNGCDRVFCENHRRRETHGCQGIQSSESVVVCKRCRSAVTVPADSDPQTTLTQHQQTTCLPVERSTCSTEGCTTSGGLVVLSPCPFCKKSFCLACRHPSDHKCPVESAARAEESKAREGKKAQVENLKEKTATGAAGASASASAKPLSDKGKATAKKVEAMKIEMKAQGETSIPTACRIPIRLHVSTAVKSASSYGAKTQPDKQKYFDNACTFHIWLDASKTLGWNLDMICSRLSIVNRNNEAGSAELVLSKEDETAGDGPGPPLLFSQEAVTLVGQGDVLWLSFRQ
uniref:AN1-type domain-containing protein n=1 Tax=Chromera velia CCMP2878 TaxID=1169474 RepID=A0A0G4GC68_9ALVE|mmetsp:Transcript_18480/g.37385  ORF Transcript_18480/g.37385 Transcript_18480/m.37385 type:complete len:309 (+) Transcript_18480:124-1050(+)|eukprot:Cvel_21245.t1-p1 / transcript=Cvel_21245.t1 / gene=Cvel_21245 / organism=Chromera_velia_CCMP2878 / gene_product=AN1-type zinc finger protein 1, putative / transcript_product=AN1-type zinc finger protein 1, putative / location=Cvel_scaffold1976:13578-16106(+) / protein_length=308 / sequence_SO=supercontig / SO=protein_coding / is_pseudo=false